MEQDSDSLDMILQYLGDRLPADLQKALDERRHRDAAFSDLCRLIEQLLAFGQAGRDFKLDPVVQSIVVRRFHETRIALAETKFDRGVVTFDSRDLPLPHGVRPAQVTTARLTYQLGDRQVILMTTPVSPNSSELIGQIHHEKRSGQYTIRLKAAGRTLTVYSDKHGLFRFARVPHGRLKLIITGEPHRPGELTLEL
jgi:hypothetical protein